MPDVLFFFYDVGLKKPAEQSPSGGMVLYRDDVELLPGMISNQDLYVAFLPSRASNLYRVEEILVHGDGSLDMISGPKDEKSLPLTMKSGDVMRISVKTEGTFQAPADLRAYSSTVEVKGVQIAPAREA